MDVYRLPVHLRNFYYKQLVEVKKQEAETTKKPSDTPKIPKGPNINVRK